MIETAGLYNTAGFNDDTPRLHRFPLATMYGVALPATGWQEWSYKDY